MREVRDGRREKILDVEDKSVRRAMFLNPRKSTSLMRALTSAKPYHAASQCHGVGASHSKKHRDKSGEMLWIFLSLAANGAVASRRRSESFAPLGAWLARTIDTKCYRTRTPIQGLFE
jgi:hypothetical protein